MRLTILAFALLPVAAHAQNTDLIEPSTPLTQSQSCPVGMAWDVGARSCAMASEGASPIQGLPGQVGCHGDATREVMS